jgi:hypothetical protein
LMSALRPDSLIAHV